MPLQRTAAMGFKVEVVYKCGHAAIRDLPFQAVIETIDSHIAVTSAKKILKDICTNNDCMDCMIKKLTKEQ